jgi:signal transduction histidine kinase
VDHLHMLARDLLDLSRIEAEAEQLPFERINIADLLDEISPVYASRAEQAAVEFALAVAAGVQVWGRRAQIRRMVCNLIDNAIKFTPAGGQVHINVVQDGDRVQVQVADTGIGIPAEDVPHLFQRFHRGRNTAGYPGSGLGLAIAQAVVASHGGEIQIASDTSGTVITALLPGRA